jgi:phosphoribosyl 1,2-cyclic phosphodiesterase
MRIDLLCSGSKGNSCLIRTESSCLLIDCGPSAKRYLPKVFSQVHCALENVQALLLTHSHSDHTRQTGLFLSVPVYAPFPRSDIKFETSENWNVIEQEEVFTIGDLQIKPLFLSHDSGPTVGYIIKDKKHKLVYITDTGYIRQDIMEQLFDADFYIFESNHDISLLQMTNRPFWLKHRIASDTGHLCNEDASRILCRLIGEHTKKIVLAHLSDEANTPELALDTLQSRLDSMENLPKNLEIAAAAQFEVCTLGELLF